MDHLWNGSVLRRSAQRRRPRAPPAPEDRARRLEPAADPDGPRGRLRPRRGGRRGREASPAPSQPSGMARRSLRRSGGGRQPRACCSSCFRELESTLRSEERKGAPARPHQRLLPRGSASLTAQPTGTYPRAGNSPGTQLSGWAPVRGALLTPVAGTSRRTRSPGRGVRSAARDLRRRPAASPAAPRADRLGRRAVRGRAVRASPRPRRPFRAEREVASRSSAARVLIAGLRSALILASLAGLRDLAGLARRIGRSPEPPRRSPAATCPPAPTETPPRELAILGDGLNRMATRIEGLVAETLASATACAP